MVVLRHLETRDFKHLDVDMTFPQGILAISGPNESGKSSIFEAILFAFFGKTHKAPLGQKDRLINYDAEQLYVRLNFEIENTPYRITRQIHRKRPSTAQLHKLSPSGQTSLLATGVKNVDQEVNSLLNGIDLSDLLASNIVLQKDLDRLAQMAKMERRHVINAMMGRECFTRVDDKLTNELRPLKNALDPENKLLDQLRHSKEDFIEHTKEYETKQKALTQIETQLKQTSQTFAQTEKSYNAVKAFKTVKDEQENLQQQIQFRTETQKRLKKQLESLGKLKSQQKKLLAQQKQTDYLKKDEKNFKTLLTITEKLRTTIDQQQLTTEAINRLKSQINELAPLQDFATEYEQVRTKRVDIETNQQRLFSPLIYIPSIGLLSAGIGTIFFNTIIGAVLLIAALPFLGYLAKTYISYSRVGPQLDELRKREEELNEQMIQYHAKMTYEDQLQEYIDRNKALTDQISELSERVHDQLGTLSAPVLDRISLPTKSASSALQNTVKETEQRFMELKASQKTITDQLQSIEEQLAEIAAVEDDLAQTETDISSLQEQLTALTFPELPEEIGEYSEKLYEDLDRQIRTIGEKKATLQANRENTKERLEELSALLKQNEGILEEFTKKEREVAKLNDNIKVGQLTIDLIREVAERGREQVRPRVVYVMERLLAAITDGKYRFPKLSEDYSLKVYSAEAGEYVDANLYSGGTEDQFLLALRLGFAIALLPQGRGATPQFLLLDEPFGGSDIERRDNIIRLLQDELSKTFQQIIVVSHQSAVLSASEHQFRMVNGRLIHSE
ncbi:MAG: AAA family ATPase [Promethearchaeota archaeon]